MICFLKNFKFTIINTPKNISFLKNKDLNCFKQYSKKVNVTLKMDDQNKNDKKNFMPFMFLKEIIEETQMVEWPSTERLFKQFVIVVISLVVSALLVFSVDGIFASLSQFLFEGKN
jgi:preprotein translocase SecE subunit